jgi:hypothetical protein
MKKNRMKKYTRPVAANIDDLVLVVLYQIGSPLDSGACLAAI